MKDKNIPTYCMFAGGVFEESYMQAMQRFIDTQRLQNNVQFVPQLTRQQLSRFFRLHHVCVFPSIYPEAFGIVAAEAMASGLALVSSGVGGAAEVFEDGISGLSFKAGDPTSLAAQLERLWSNPMLLQTLQKNGEQRAETVQRSTIGKRSRNLVRSTQAPITCVKAFSVRRWSYINERRRAALPY